MFSRRHILAVPFAALLRGASTPEIRFDGSSYRVEGWQAPAQAPEDGWGSVLSLYTGVEDTGAPAMLGKYSVEDGVLRFTPRFPVSVTVRAVFRAPGSAPVETVFPASNYETNPNTRIEHVYPSANVLPANLLRFYVQFSAPMQRGEAWDHISLLDRSGQRMELPFLELDQELWDAEGKRITILFDPGRIKRGVLPREESGSALVEGDGYSLVIDAKWRDQNGAPLVASYRKQFRAGPEARAAIDLKDWRVQAPAADTAAPLVIDFPAPLDYALANRLLEVHGNEGRLAGNIALVKNETQWQFTPDAAWKSGDYRLQVDTALEDVAGNRVGKPFDVDVFDPITTRITPKTESLAFRVVL